MKQREWMNRSFVQIGMALATALIGGFLFKLLHAPIPWLLGPMLAVLIGNQWLKGYYRWPGVARNAGMIIVGYTIGLSMTGAALLEMWHQLPSMLMVTLLLMSICAGLAYIVSKLSGTNYRTAILGSIPGGLTQSLVLAEETEGVNMTIVTVTQVIRLMIIIICVPLLVFSPLLGGVHHQGASANAMLNVPAAGWAGLFPNLIFFAIASIVCAWIGNKIKFPTAYLLGPAIGTAVLQMNGLHGPALPAVIINAAQLMIGVNVGLLLKPANLPNKLRTVSLAVGSGLLLMLGSFGLSVLLTAFQPISESTSLLSLAPGGMDQMGIIAHEIHADLSMVAGYQLFRTFFINFIMAPVLRILLKAWTRKAEAT